VQRLWARDAALWTGADEGRRLGWLGTTDDQLALISHLRQAAQNVKTAGFTHALLIGMGGTVLGVDALARTFGKTAGFPALHLIDSTDPAQVQAVERALDLARTLGHRLEQVGQHARAQRAARVLLRAHEGGGRAGRGRPPLRGHHRRGL
jgi:hypothetical protein